MRRRVPILAVLAALAVPTAAAGRPTPPPADPAAGPPPVSVRVLECSKGKAPEGGRAVFRAAMALMPGGTEMRMRFKLEQQVGDGVFRGVRAPGLNVWRKSRPGVGRFAYRQRVLGLEKGSSYRVAVQFRWYDSEGKRIRSARKRSRACRQGGRLPNLAVAGDPVVRPGPAAGTALYLVDVANRGRASASGVEVVLSVDGAEVDREVIGSLRPGRTRTVSFVGPVCRQGLEVQIDPRDTLRETTRADNVRAAACTAAG